LVWRVFKVIEGQSVGCLSHNEEHYVKRKEKARAMHKFTDKSLPIDTGEGVNPWDTAIQQAKSLIADAEKRVIELRKAATAFKVMRDSGEPWPGTCEVNVGEPKTETRRLHQG
jgi:hypothetical protein